VKNGWKIAVVVAVVAAIGVVLAAKNSTSPNDGPVKDMAEVEALASPPSASEALPRFVEVGADSCVPCKMMQPVLDELRADYTGELAIEFADVWKNPELGEKYGVRTIPTQIIYDAGGTEVFRHTGFWPKEGIDAKLEELEIID